MAETKKILITQTRSIIDELERTKRTIKALLACGFRRSEFSAQTPFDYQRKGYENTRAYFRTAAAAT